MESRFRRLARRSPLAFALAVMGLTGGAFAAPISGQGTWETTLQARDINNDSVVDAYYDTSLNITWLANWNANGLMNWNVATAWAAALNVHGVTGWRLPAVGPSDGAFDYAFSNNGSTDRGYAKTGTGWGAASEYGHMYYVTLGNKGVCTPNDALPGSCAGQSGWGLSNSAQFSNMLLGGYWSGTEYAANPSNSWFFNTYDGDQNNVEESRVLYAVAVVGGVQ
ncbi:MAG: hypothetical protein IT514_09595 [Burkholderiales bacterium]|nr:hypothetical protein [Burkholderiales bacterium]